MNEQALIGTTEENKAAGDRIAHSSLPQGL